MKLPRLSTKDFLRDLADFAQSQREAIEASVDGFAPSESARAERVQRSKRDYSFFKRTYFPHYCSQPNSVLHDYLDERLPQIVDHAQGQHDVIAAPRGEAKSTNVSLIFVAWCLLTERKHYVVIVMDAFDQAAVMLEALKGGTLHNDLGASVDGTGGDDFWTSDRITVDVRCVYSGIGGQQLWNAACTADPQSDNCQQQSADWYVVNANGRLRTLSVSPSVQYGVGGLGVIVGTLAALHI